MDYIYVGKNIIIHNRRGHNQTPSIRGYVHKSHLKEELKFDFYKSMNIAGVGRLADNYSLSNTVELGLKNGWYFSTICNHETGLNYLPLNLKYHTEVYENKIDAVYHGVIKFIEWYNQQN